MAGELPQDLGSLLSNTSQNSLRPALESAGVGLRISNVRKQYAQTHALRGVSFNVEPGTIHALLGGNGSGKSTLIKVLAGVEHGAGEGQIALNASTVSDDKTSPEWARDNGLVFVHQDLGLFEGLTVAENLAAGAAFPHRRGIVAWKRIESHAKDLLNEFRIDVRPNDPVAVLRPAQKTLVAVARALGTGAEQRARVLVLDEPTASLPAVEADRLLTSLTEFRDQGYAIIYVTHRLGEVLDVGDRVTVLRDGNVVADRDVKGLSKPDLIELVAGRRLGSVFPDRSAQPGDVVLSVRGLRGGPLQDFDLDVRAGEIVGIAGLVGSGRSSVLRSIYGLHPRQGTVTVHRTQTKNGSRNAIRDGLAYVPEDRALDGVFGHLSISVNVAASHDHEYLGTGWHKSHKERTFAASVIDRLGVKAPSPSVPVASLSGGNQQKVVLGRWLRPSTKVLLLDEPTQGVDVGARSDIYSQIGKLRDQGLGIILVSSDEEELLGLADQIVVLQRGVIIEQRRSQEATSTWLSHAVHGLNHDELNHDEVEDTP